GKTKPMQPDHLKPTDGDDETEEGEGEGTAGGPAKTQENATGAGDPGGGSSNAGGSRGGRGGVHSKPSIPIRYRTYAQDTATGVYSVTVVPERESKTDAMLVISTVGDDQTAPAEIKSARFAAGGDIPLAEAGVIGPVKLGSAAPLKLEVVLAEPLRVAMEVAAHEA
ncbi:MAG TPA: hypothetical protein VFA65_20940, partial [Bryobacteraceae bacterium]|nr:hypothetical protein [Bryobacteraceae bacterium]